MLKRVKPRWKDPKVRRTLHRSRIKVKREDLESIFNKICKRKLGRVLKIKLVLDKNDNQWYGNEDYVACIGKNQLNYNIMFLGYYNNPIYDTLLHELAHHLAKDKPYKHHYIYKKYEGHHKEWADIYLGLGGLKREVRRCKKV